MRAVAATVILCWAAAAAAADTRVATSLRQQPSLARCSRSLQPITYPYRLVLAQWSYSTSSRVSTEMGDRSVADPKIWNRGGVWGWVWGGKFLKILCTNNAFSCKIFTCFRMRPVNRGRRPPWIRQLWPMAGIYYSDVLDIKLLVSRRGAKRTKISLGLGFDEKYRDLRIC